MEVKKAQQVDVLLHISASEFSTNFLTAQHQEQAYWIIHIQNLFLRLWAVFNWTGSQYHSSFLEQSHHL